MNWAELIAAIVPSVLVILGLVFGFGKWSSHMEAKITSVFDRLSGEIKNLTKAAEQLSDTSEKQSENSHNLAIGHENHETRITVLEREITELKNMLESIKMEIRNILERIK